MDLSNLVQIVRDSRDLTAMVFPLPDVDGCVDYAITEAGETKYVTPAGTAAVSAPSQTVTYDAKAIDILLRDDPDLALRLSPYRKVTERAGSLTIRGGAQ